MSFTPGPGTTYLLTSTQPIPSGTANGVLYLNGSKVVTSGSALTFDGSAFWVAASSLSSDSLNVNGFRFGSGTFKQQFSGGFDFQQYYTAAGQAAPQAAIFADTATWGVKITGAEQMRLTSTGLGIGTSSPANKLHVTVSAASTAAAAIYNTDASNGNGVYIKAGGSNSGKYALAIDNAAGTSLALLDSSGNLGLGVTPSAWGAGKNIETGRIGNFIYGATGASTLAIGSNAYQNSGWKYANSSSAAGMYDITGNVHSWYTAPSGTAGNSISFTQAMTLDASGNLGVGVTNPAAKLEVYGGASGTITNIQVGNASTAFQVGVDSSNNCQIRTSQNVSMLFYTNATERARITSGGNFVVGTAALATTATDGFLYVPTCDGTPTGTPTTQTGTAPIVVDTTNNKLYFYSGGQWRDAGP